ncbi:MAG: F0F1 ATP synthase subunit B [Chloroflexi bacterium]|nr:F0F1 ATP synthase subunit B [Chloroflexota bacterium]
MAQLGFHWPSLVIYLVNFLILLGILYVMGYKPILRMLDQRSEKIKESLEEADRVRRESAKAQEEMQQRLEEAHQEGQRLLEEARQAAERYREEERKRARQEAAAFLERARGEIRKERDSAIEEVRGQFADLAILAAERVIERSLDKAAHREIIDKVLEESSKLERN